MSADLRGCVILDRQGEPLAASGELEPWARPPAASSRPPTPPPGEPVTQAHVGTEDGEVFAVRLGGYAAVAAAERFALAGFDAVRPPRRAARSRPRRRAGGGHADASEAAPGPARPRHRLRRRGLRLPASPPAHPPAVRARLRPRRPDDRAGARRPRRAASSSWPHRGCSTLPATTSASERRDGPPRILQPRGPRAPRGHRVRARGAIGRALGQARLARLQVRRVPAPRRRRRRRRALARRPARLEPGHLHAPVDPRSDAIIYINSTAATLHPDFGSPREYGIPYWWSASAPSGSRSSSPPTATSPTAAPTASRSSAPVEGGAGADGDRHVIAYDKARCKLYELYRAFPRASGAGAPTSA